MRRAGRRWAVVVPAVTAAAVAAGWALSVALPGSRADAAEADRTAGAATVAHARAVTVRVRVAAARQALGAAREVADQPDWSLLLADLSRRLGDDGVLSTCQLATPGDGHAGVTLRLGGLARTQPAVTLLALRLEEANLFDRVDLLQTTPAQLGGTDAVGFQIVCTIGTTAAAGRTP